MFAYAFGRLLAESLEYALEAKPVRGFPNTAQVVHGTILAQSDVLIKDSLEPFDAIMARCAGHKVRVHGYFEQSRFYLEHQAKLKEWFIPEIVKSATNKTVVHIRGTDFIKHGKILPQQYYLDALETLGNPSDVIICTDDPFLDVVKYFQAQGAAISSESDLKDFATMMAAKHLVTSLSTFAWWAGFLSNSIVVQPIPKKGWRSAENQKFNLDNPRWIGIPC